MGKLTVGMETSPATTCLALQYCISRYFGCEKLRLLNVAPILLLDHHYTSLKVELRLVQNIVGDNLEYQQWTSCESQDIGLLACYNFSNISIQFDIPTQ